MSWSGNLPLIVGIDEAGYGPVARTACRGVNALDGPAAVRQVRPLGGAQGLCAAPAAAGEAGNLLSTTPRSPTAAQRDCTRSSAPCSRLPPPRESTVRVSTAFCTESERTLVDRMNCRGTATSPVLCPRPRSSQNTRRSHSALDAAWRKRGVVCRGVRADVITETGLIGVWRRRGTRAPC